METSAEAFGLQAENEWEKARAGQPVALRSTEGKAARAIRLQK
jgi:hypothetical protein